MKALALLLAYLALAGCTKKTTVLAPPGDALGEYRVHWSTGLDSAALVTLDGVLFTPYPCAITTDISGVYDYDPNSGDFAADLKTIGMGDAHLEIEGHFRGRTMLGEFTLKLDGLLCVEGKVMMDRTP